MASILQEGLIGSLKLIFAVATIVIPLLTLLEVIKNTKLFERFSRVTGKLVAVFRLPAEAALPLLVGLVFGIAYGAGVILQASREGHLSRRDFTLIFFFFALNHGIIEDTLIFSRIGAKGWVLITVRFTLAVTFVFVLSRILKPTTETETARREN